MTRTRLERDDGLAVLTLDNPPLNQISGELVDDLIAAVDTLEGSDVRALLVRASGDLFSAGADVQLFAGRSAAKIRPLIARFLELGRRVEALPFPTLGAVHGLCVAAGLELVLFLDLIWAAEDTKLALLETRLGIVPLAAGIERVAARAGVGRARAIALGGNLFPAEQRGGGGRSAPARGRRGPSTTCSTASRTPSRANAGSWPMHRTNCARR